MKRPVLGGALANTAITASPSHGHLLMRRWSAAPTFQKILSMIARLRAPPTPV